MTKSDATRETIEQLAFWKAPPKLELRAVCGSVDVRVGGLTIASYETGDKASRNIAIVSVADGGLFPAKEIAAAFGIAESRVAQIRKRYRDGGAALLLSSSPGVRGPRILNAGDIARARAWRRDGLVIEEIVAKLNRGGRRTSRSSIGRLVKGIGPRTGDLALPEPATAVEAPPLAAGEGAEDVPAASEAAVAPSAPTEAVESPTPVEAVEPPTLEMSGQAEAVGEPAAAIAEVAGAGAALESVASVGTPPAAVAVPETTRDSTVAGAMVAHAALHALGLRSALAASGACLRPATTFDLLRTAAVIFFGVVLRYRSIESLRLLIREDFGALLGLPRAPEIRTVRRKLKEIGSLATLFNETEYIRDLARTLLRQAPAPEGVYFFDDHFKAYHGKEPLAKGWDAKRRIGAPGLEDVYVHDLKGRALLFVPLPAPTSLSRAMPLALRELRAVAPTAPTLAVFDRGGWSKDLFHSLVHPAAGEARLDFLTYLKARGKRRELPLEAFTKVSYEEGGRQHTCEVAETTLAMKGFAAPLRLIILLDRKKGKQIPILTSLEGVEAAKLVHLLRARWRQENSFKYLVGELAIDALVSHDMTLVPDDREVDNPERAALKVELGEAERALAIAERAIARALASNEEARRPTVRGFKIAHSELTRVRDVHAARVAAIREEITALPAKRRRNEIVPGARVAKPTTQRRVFVNGLKLLAHNAEKWLADRLDLGPYRSHALPILRALFQQPGRITFATDRVRVEIRPLDTPRYQACVATLLRKLNEERVTFLDTGLPIEFSVAPSPGTTHS